MKPLMPPALFPRNLPASARSGSQSKIAEEVIRRARQFYEEETLFQEVQSATKKVVSFGNLNFGTQSIDKQKPIESSAKGG